MEWKELVELFRKLGLEKEDAEYLADRIKVDGYELVINPESAEIGSGGQYFGSGGYWHSFRIWIPKGAKLNEVAEILDKKGYDNGFVSGTWYKIKPKIKPLVISHSRGDGIGQGRRFNAEVFVWY